MAIKREDIDAGRVDFSDVASGKKTSSSHPGGILKRMFLKQYDLSVSAAAKAMGIPRSRLNQIVRGERDITADTALRLSLFFGNSAQFWMNLQTHYDLAEAKTKASRSMKKVLSVTEYFQHI